MAKKDKAKDKAKDDEEEDKAPEAGGEEGAEGAEGEGGEAAPAKKSKKKLIIIAAVAVLALGGIAAGVVFSGVLSKSEKKAEGVELDEHGNPINKTVYYTLPEFLINLNTASKSSSFLKTTVILELSKPTDVPIIESNLPRLVDSINTYLRELRSSDLAGSAGIQRLREEILLRVNKAVAPLQVTDVLFKEIVVQ